MESFFGADASATGYAAGDLPETFSYTPQLLTRGATAAITAGGDAAAGAGSGLAWGLGGAAAAQAANEPKAQQKTAPVPTFMIDNSVPKNARNCAAEGHSSYAPPSFNLQAIENAGKSNVFNAFNPSAMNSAVGHYGTFDFQRVRDSFGSTTFYSAYTPVSNVAVGAYLYSAGCTKLGASTVSNTFALFRSKNAGDPNQALYRNIGVDLAAGKAKVTCLPK